MTGHTCPADECDYGETEEKTKGSVASHINATSDDAHADKSALRQQLERQDPAATDDTATDTDPEADESDDRAAESEESEPEEAAEEGTEAADDSDDTDTEDMATEDEYQEQQDKSGGESSDGGDKTDGATGAEAAAAGGLLAGSLGGVSPAVLLALAVGAVLIWMLFSGGGGSDGEAPTEATKTGGETGGEAGSSEDKSGLVA